MSMKTNFSVSLLTPRLDIGAKVRPHGRALSLLWGWDTVLGRLWGPHAFPRLTLLQVVTGVS